MIRSWIIYLFLLFLDVLLSILVPFRLFLLLIPVLLLFPCFLFVLLLYQKRKIRLSLSAEEEERSLFTYLLTVTNNSVLPLSRCRCRIRCISLFYQEENKLKLTFSVAGKGSRQLMGTLTLPSVSKYTLALEEAVIYDWFSLFSFRLKAKPKVSLIHWPESIAHLLSTTLNEWIPKEQDTDLPGNGGSDFSQISGLRAYHPGDRLQSIHWKLSSKQNDYIVKEYPRTNTRELTLLAGITYPASKEVYNAYFSLVFSTAEELIRKRLPFTICWYSPEEDRLREYPITGQDELFSMFRDWLSIPASSYAGKDPFSATPRHSSKSPLIYFSCDDIYQHPEPFKPLFSEFPEPVSVLQPAFSRTEHSNLSPSVRVREIPLSAFSQEENSKA